LNSEEIIQYKIQILRPLRSALIKLKNQYLWTGEQPEDFDYISNLNDKIINIIRVDPSSDEFARYGSKIY
jgi:hypothetical protein